MFDTLDHIDKLAEDITAAKTSLEAIDKIIPQIIVQLKLTADDSEALAKLLVSTYGQSSLQSTQTDQTFFDQVNVGLDFDQSRSDDFFYIPHEGFDNDDVKTGMKLLMSPDGKAARFIVTHDGGRQWPGRRAACRTVPQRDHRGAQRDLAGRREDLYRRVGVNQQGHQGIRRCPIC